MNKSNIHLNIIKSYINIIELIIHESTTFTLQIPMLKHFFHVFQSPAHQSFNTREHLLCATMQTNGISQNVKTPSPPI